MRRKVSRRVWRGMGGRRYGAKQWVRKETKMMSKLPHLDQKHDHHHKDDHMDGFGLKEGGGEDMNRAQKNTQKNG